MSKQIPILLFLILAIPFIASADQEAGNRTYVKSSEYGQFYVKSIPTERYGLEGKTHVYRVTEEEDKLLHSFSWYSPEIYIYGFATGDPVYVIKFGPWHRGRKARSEDLGIALYKNGQLLKEYSTLDIVGEETNVSASVSHYQIYRKKIGFRRPWGNQIVFDVEAHNGNILSFDTETGERISKQDEALFKQLYDIRQQMGQIKWAWYQLHKDQIENIKDYPISEEELRKVEPDKYPDPPDGYKIIPNAMWTPADIIKH